MSSSNESIALTPEALEESLRLFGVLCGDYESRVTDWKILATWGLIRSALVGLKEKIEDQNVPEISWETPYAQLQYSTGYNWKRNQIVLDPTDMIAVNVSKEVLDEETARFNLASTIIARSQLIMLGILTHHAAYRKDLAGRFTPWFSREVMAELEKLPDEKQEEAVKQLLEPYWVWHELISTESILAGEPAASDFPLFEIDASVQVNGRRIELIPFIKFHPLTVDEEHHAAYYTIEVWLQAADLSESGPQPLMPSLETWPDESKQAVWENLFREVDESTESYMPNLEGEQYSPEELGSGLKPDRILPRSAGMIYGGTMIEGNDSPATCEADASAPAGIRITPGTPINGNSPVPVFLPEPEDLLRPGVDVSEGTTEKLRRGIAAWENVLKEREQEGRWAAKRLLMMVHDALYSLRQYIEDPNLSEVSWSYPWVELQSDVVWNTERECPIPGYLEAEDLQSEERLVHRLAELAVRFDMMGTFHELTFGSMIIQRAGETHHRVRLDILPKEIITPEIMAAIPSMPEETQRELFSTFTKPCSLGTYPPGMDSPDPWFSGNDDLPLIVHVTETNDETGETRKTDVYIIVDVYPLFVNLDAGKAYYSTVIGLAFRDGETGEPVDTSDWSDENKAGFWQELLSSFMTGITDLTTPEPEIVTEAEEGHESTAPASVPTEGNALTPPDRVEPYSPIAFVPTRASAQALGILKNTSRFRLPRRWSNIPRIEDLERDEIDRLLAEERKSGEKSSLLKRTYSSTGEERVRLSDKGLLELKLQHGKRGYISWENGQRLWRMIDCPDGSRVEIGLSWNGIVWPLIDSRRKEWQEEAERLRKDIESRLAFEDLNSTDQRRVDRMLKDLYGWEKGRDVMEAILAQLGVQKTNPVIMPAESFRLLLWPNGDFPDEWKQVVDSILSLLRAMDFRANVYGNPPIKGEASFIGEWWYHARGKGGHGEGVYAITVMPGFVGCLRIYENAEKVRLRCGREALTYDFSHKPTDEQEEEIGWGRGRTARDRFVQFDSGRPWYSQAAGLTDKQKLLHQYIEHNLTRQADTCSKARWGRDVKVHKNAKDARENRRYTSAFCPLLPPGTEYCGALSCFVRNPEAGITLYGTESKAARHTAGLLQEMGYLLPTGGAKRERQEIVASALGDLKAVVVEYLGGVVAGLHNGAWIPFEKFASLDEQSLCRKLRLFLFIPVDFNERRQKQWEQTTGKRVTTSAKEAERLLWEGVEPTPANGETTRKAEPIASPETAYRGLPLYERLRFVMKDRGLRQQAVSSIFGVSQPTVAYWLKGTIPDMDGKVYGKPIPEELVPLVVRWIERGEAPTAEELASRKTRRIGRKGSEENVQ